MQWPWRKVDTDLEREGLTRSAAMRRARAEFGGVDRTKEECRDESRWNWLARCAQDIRFGWRMTRKRCRIQRRGAQLRLAPALLLAPRAAWC
ncbi:MAG: hypothetical protein JJE04_25590 [Acidobacteriia bacterium]|nr:hypothetical protein [Terriglobia bacterium]